MGTSKTDGEGDVAKGILMVIAFFAIAWPYFLGTWLAVQLGASNPSTARDIAGWVLEALWLIALSCLAIGWWLREKQRETEARHLEAVRRQRVVEFGPAGARLFKEAEESVLRIAASEAARTGWLGDPADFDFHADLEAIADNLRRGKEIRAVTADASAIQGFTESDKQMLHDAQLAVARLENSVKQRVKLIGECSRHADDIDRTLREDRESVAMAKRRDDLRDRLGPILYSSGTMPTETVSESADVVTARATAFHDLKVLLDKHRIEAAGE
ncbi:hypothetical protein A5649_09300 [Mycolicibacter heraklionensis]|uniref:Uncharacterized protein n=1 Tax=Mycolicibacter heraklionensis TaxID=512402 RepID=A0AA91ES54_9MYCO|nr:hypothetical protein [Mycolicibacter heraklionensis]OBK82276.1 hypothetical protein A5649_09300 [Mycolicibacter heraklionensis]